MFAKYARPNTRKAIIQILNTFLPFVALWVLMYFSLEWSYWITLGLAVVNAFFMVRIFIIQHDCGHRSFLKSQRWNKVIGTICSFFSTIPFTYWAKEHDFHHGHTGQLEVRTIGDIWIMTADEYQNSSRWKQFLYRVYRMPFMTFILGPVIYLLVNNRFEIVKLPGWKRFHRAMHINNLFIVLVYALLGWLIGWKQFFLIQIPIVVLFAIIAVWFFYVQHQHEETYKQWQDKWDFLTAAVQGSTYYKLPRLIDWFTGYIGYHHIHHLNSKIPNYHLKWAHRENRFMERYITILNFRESLKCMYNKLWCEQEQRMITFREFRQRELAA